MIVSEIIDLKTKRKDITPREFDKDAIDLLESMIAKVRSGEISGISIATILAKPDGSLDGTGSAWAGSVPSNPHIAIAGLQLLQARIMRELFE